MRTRNNSYPDLKMASSQTGNPDLPSLGLVDHSETQPLNQLSPGRVESERPAAEVEDSSTGWDPIYERLKRLPFFANADPAEQARMYRDEQEREDRREQAEREERRWLREQQQAAEQEERRLQLEMKRLEATTRTPDAAPAIKPKVILPQWEASSKMDKYLETCERLLEGAQAAEATWVSHILPRLPEKAQGIYNHMPKEQANVYSQLKKELLNQYAVSPLVYRRNFFTWDKKGSQTYVEHLESLQAQMDAWIRGLGLKDDNINWRDLLLRYRMDQCLPEEIQVLLLGKGNLSAKACAEFADEHVVNQRVVRKVTKNSSDNRQTQNSGRPHPYKDKFHQSTSSRPTSNSQQQNRRSDQTTDRRNETYCSYCKKAGHATTKCWFNPDSSCYQKFPRNWDTRTSGNQANQPNNRGTMARGQQNHQGNQASVKPESDATGLVYEQPQRLAIHPYYEEYAGDAWIAHSSAPVTYLRDTGATLSFLHRGAIPEGHQLEALGENVTVTGIHHQQGTYPLCRLHISCDRYRGPLTVAITEKPPLPGVDLLLGNDLDHVNEPYSVVGAVVTRSKSKAQELQDPPSGELEKLFSEESGTSSVNHENSDPSTEPQGQPVGDSTSEGDSSEPEVGSPTPEGEDLDPLELAGNPTALLREQENDPTLAPLWALTRQADQGYYTDTTTGVLLYHLDGTDPDESQIVVPRPARQKLLEWAHDHPSSGHLSSKKMLPRLRQYFTWPGVRRDVAEYCRGCGPCQRIGKGVQQQTALLKSLPIVGRPFSLVSADFVGPLPLTAQGNRYALTCIDHATKYLEVIPLPAIDAEHTKQAFIEIFSRHGVPRQLLTDQGSTFTCEGFSLFLQELQIEPLLTPSYRPESNATIERSHGTLKAMLKACIEGHPSQDWDRLLPWILFAYRSAEHSSTGYSPFRLLYGREPTSILGLVHASWLNNILEDTEVPAHDYIRYLQEELARIQARATEAEELAQERSARNYNAKHHAKPLRYKPGDMVLINLPKRGKPLEGEWQGPYPIISASGEQTYLVSTPDKRVKRRKAHVNALRRWTEQPGSPFTCAAASTLDASVTVGDLMDSPGDPTYLERQHDPGNYGISECLPDGTLPDFSQLSDAEKADANSLCQAFIHLFDGPIGRFSDVVHDIDVGNHSPIKQNYYRCSPDKLRTLKTEVQTMLDLGVIRTSRSEWSSPLILVKKPNGTWRPCVDYRKVNAITRGESYPLPRLDDLVDQVGNSAYITTLDLAKGYWQIELTPRAQAVSAFSTPFGHYEFITMPFGLKLAPLTFQRAMNNLLTGLSDYATAYLDDIAIRSNTWEEHCQHVQTVFQHLDQAGLTLNAKKCVFGGAKVKYLGHEVGSGEVTPIRTKVEAIAELPIPTTKTEVRSFLGSVGFYRKFIPHYSEVAAPLTDLLKGNRKGSVSKYWTPACQRAFEALKASLLNQPVLKAPNFDLPFEIYTDASELGIAAVLTQESQGHPCPVAYYSRKLLPREARYSTVEKELLAIMAALDQFKIYVGMGPVTIHSDHRPLVWLRKCSSPNQRILRWALTLSEYDLEVQHIKGSDNCLADMLSRQFPAQK